MQHRFWITTLSLGMGLMLAATSAQASLIDTMDDVDHFTPWGEFDIDIIDNEDGTVTIQRTMDAQGNAASGVDWGDPDHPIAGNRIAWSPQVDRLELTPDARVNDGQYNVVIQYWDETGFLGSSGWIAFNHSTDVQTLESVQQHAIDADAGLDNFTDFGLRFRFRDQNVTFNYTEGNEPGFTFSDIRAIPEPGAMGLLGLGGLLILSVRRRIRS